MKCARKVNKVCQQGVSYQSRQNFGSGDHNTKTDVRGRIMPLVFDHPSSGTNQQLGDGRSQVLRVGSHFRLFDLRWTYIVSIIVNNKLLDHRCEKSTLRASRATALDRPSF